MFFAFVIAFIVAVGGLLYELPARVQALRNTEAESNDVARLRGDIAGQDDGALSKHDATNTLTNVAAARLAIATASREGKIPYDVVQAMQAVEANQTTQLQGEQRHVSDLSDKLAHAEQLAAQADALQRQLSDEHTQAAGLEHDLTEARAQLAAARQESTVNGEAAQALATQMAQLQGEQRHVSELSDKLAHAEQLAAQADALQRQLSDEHTQAAGLEHDLAEARAQLAAARQESTVNGEAAQALANQTAQLQGEQRHVSELSDKLAHAEQLAAQADALQRQLSDEHTQAAGLEHDLTEARAQLAAARQESTVNGEAAQALANQTAQLQGDEAERNLQSSSIIADVPARVLVRYTTNDMKAQARAFKIKDLLQHRGFVVDDVFGSPALISSDHVTYFYGQDRFSAARVAGLVSSTKPTQNRLSSSDPLPRPGTVEIAISE